MARLRCQMAQTFPARALVAPHLKIPGGRTPWPVVLTIFRTEAVENSRQTMIARTFHHDDSHFRTRTQQPTRGLVRLE
jgi:hypothetical protein